MIRRILIILSILFSCNSSNAMFNLDNCSWEEKQSMPTARSEFASITHNNKIYVLGGISGDKALSNFEVYNAIENTWKTLENLPIPNHHGALGIVENKIYLIGGFVDLSWRHANGIIFEYDIESNKWNNYDELFWLRVAHSAETVDNNIYIFGGHGYKPSHLLYYNPLTKKMKELETNMPAPADHIATTIDKNNFIVLGGRFRNGNLQTIRIFDRKKNRWMANEGLPYPTSGHIAEIVNNRLHVAGGEDIDKKTTFNSHYYYDFDENKWFESIQLPQSLHGIGSAVIEDRLFIFGGATGAGELTFNSVQDKIYELTCN